MTARVRVAGQILSNGLHTRVGGGDALVPQKGNCRTRKSGTICPVSIRRNGRRHTHARAARLLVGRTVQLMPPLPRPARRLPSQITESEAAGKECNSAALVYSTVVARMSSRADVFVFDQTPAVRALIGLLFLRRLRCLKIGRRSLAVR